DGEIMWNSRRREQVVTLQDHVIEQFMETVSPLPEHDYFRFYKADN
ncbi:unnamed protein product, partial [Didymodactylos carnosus]